MRREAKRSQARGYELQAIQASLLDKLHTCKAVTTQCGTENCLEMFPTRHPARDAAYHVSHVLLLALGS
jgi:hypothetical protein